MISQNNQMANSLEMQQCFDSLPPYMQENIKQCGIQFQTAQQMKEYAQHMDAPQKETPKF